MDLHLSGAVASSEERAAIDGVLASPAPGLHAQGRDDLRAQRERRHLLLPALRAVQSGVGWISPGALEEICRRLAIPPAEAYGVASFYALLSLEPQPPTMVHVCDDLACLLSDGDALSAELEHRLGPDGSGRVGRVGWRRSNCLGLCDRAPAALVTVAGNEPAETVLAPADASIVASIVAGDTSVIGEIPRPSNDHAPAVSAGSPSVLLRRVGHVDPSSLDEYRAHDGYEALRRAIELGPEAVIGEVTDARLVGRGGAAFPTGRKWEAVARASARPHELVCNADESEPGTFKDRVLMEHDPFAVIEAMTVAGYATGCERGFLYVRGEYPLAAMRLGTAIAHARAHGLLGDDVMGRGVRFDVDLRRGGGAYICGEETALLNSIEGRRGEPRNRPPFPVTEGLFGRPTVVDNVETLVDVLAIVLEGSAAFAATGTPSCTGTKLFCVSGHVERAGVFEVPFGTTLRELVAMAGGVRAGRRLQAVLLGGAAGSFLGPEHLDTTLTFDGVRAVGSELGSGAVIVVDETADLALLLSRIARFFRDESCGQCVPCRIGTVRQEELLARLGAGRALGSVDDELALLAELGRTMRDTSICGLGQTATTAAESAVTGLSTFGATP